LAVTRSVLSTDGTTWAASQDDWRAACPAPDAGTSPWWLALGGSPAGRCRSAASRWIGSRGRRPLSRLKETHMPRFMDYHGDLKLPAEAIAQIADDTRDAKADQFGVRQVELYHNAQGNVYCLLHA